MNTIFNSAPKSRTPVHAAYRKQFYPGLFLFFLAFTFSLRAQQPVQLNFSTREGLPSGEVYDILQDSKEYLWFATDAGVSRYDGAHFQNFTTADNLPDNTVFGMYEDWHGRIWFYTYSGRLAYWEKDSIYQVGVNKAITRVQGSGLISSFLIDAGDTIWCGVQGGKGYYKILPGYGEKDLRVIPCIGSYSVWPNGAGAQCIYGSTPCADCDKLIVNEYSGEKTLGCITTPGIKIGGTLRATVSAGKTIYGFQEGLLIRNDTGHFFLRTPPTITALKTDREGATWMGLLKKGVYRLSSDGTWEPSGLHLLPDNTVTDVLENGDGGFWISTLENGVYYFPSLHCRTYTAATGFPVDLAYGIRAEAGIVYAYYLQNTFARISDSLPQYINPGKLSRHIMFVQPWGEDRLLLVDTVLSFYQPSTNRSSAIKCFPTIFSQNLYDAVYTGKGFGWALNRDHLLKIDAGAGTAKEVAVLPGRCFSLCMGPGDTLWIGGLNGLWKFYGGDLQYCGNDEPLLRNRIDDIEIAADGSMWMATRGGGVLVRRGNKVVQLGKENGLPSMICRSVCIDHDTIWVGTNAGLCFFRLHEKKYRAEQFPDQDYLLSNDVRMVCRTTNSLWTLTGNGLIAYELPYRSKTTAPPVYITAVSVNGIRQALKDTIEMRYGNTIALSFAGLAWPSNAQLVYRYRLSGLDKSWQRSGNTGVQFSSLPPGEYIFEVFASAKNGKESSVPARLHLVILPQFWQTGWFRGLAGIFVAALLFLLFRIRLQSIKRKARLENRIALLELSALRAQMNPHFIFNAINSIQQFILENDPRAAQKYLSMFARLIRRVLENSRQDVITLQQELDALTLYIDLELLRFSSRFAYSLEYSNEIDPLSLRIPPMLIQPFAENAILHGLMPLENRSGRLRIYFELSENRLHITIDDNGIGREAANRNKARKEQLHQSVGLSVTEKRLEMLNTGIPDKVTVIITDKKDAEENPEGTRVEIFIPI